MPDVMDILKDQTLWNAFSNATKERQDSAFAKSVPEWGEWNDARKDNYRKTFLARGKEKYPEKSLQARTSAEQDYEKGVLARERATEKVEPIARGAAMGMGALGAGAMGI